MSRIRHTPDDIASALQSLHTNQGNISATARTLGISPSTLTDWRDRRDADRLAESQIHPPGSGESLLEIPEQLCQTGNHGAAALADACEALTWRLLGSITQEQIERASVMARVTGAAILVDKMLLLRGQPGQIVAYRDADLVGRSFAELEAMLVEVEPQPALPPASCSPERADGDLGDAVAFTPSEPPGAPGGAI